MKADEVRKIVERQESMGLSQVLLKIVKPKSYRQTSEYMRTPFGKCLSRFNRETDETVEFVIFVPIESMKKWLKKHEVKNDQA